MKCNWLNHEDRGGYVPGEAINIWATIDNQSKVTIKGTRASLTEVGTCPSHALFSTVYNTVVPRVLVMLFLVLLTILYSGVS